MKKYFLTCYIKFIVVTPNEKMNRCFFDKSELFLFRYFYGTLSLGSSWISYTDIH